MDMSRALVLMHVDMGILVTQKQDMLDMRTEIDIETETETGAGKEMVDMKTTDITRMQVMTLAAQIRPRSDITDTAIEIEIEIETERGNVEIMEIIQM